MPDTNLTVGKSPLENLIQAGTVTAAVDSGLGWMADLGPYHSVLVGVDALLEDISGDADV